MQESIFSTMWVPEKEIQVTRLSSKHTYLLSYLVAPPPPGTLDLFFYAKCIPIYKYTLQICPSFPHEGRVYGARSREAGLGVRRKPVRQSKLHTHCGLIRWDPLSIPRITFRCPVFTLYFCLTESCKLNTLATLRLRLIIRTSLQAQLPFLMYY